LEYVHSKNYIHRDVKPDNFLVGLGKDRGTIYIIDFGLAKKYRDESSHEHIKFCDQKGITGTVRYSSINTHFGLEQSRRDDMESLAFNLVYLMNGSLPWQGIRGQDRHDKYKRIGRMKIGYRVEELCKGLPHEFVTYFNYVRNLQFEEEPDYNYLRSLFRDVMRREGYQYDQQFDWTIGSDSEWESKFRKQRRRESEQSFLENYNEKHRNREKIRQQNKLEGIEGSEDTESTQFSNSIERNKQQRRLQKLKDKDRQDRLIDYNRKVQTWGRPEEKEMDQVAFQMKEKELELEMLKEREQQLEREKERQKEQERLEREKEKEKYRQEKERQEKE
ncbi:MAG: putative Casein kinase I, partial [Streblomastix strix]